MAIDLIYRGSSGNVKAVNGKVGYVVLTAEDVGALPVETEIPSIEGLASEAFVNEAISKIDLSPYQTEEEVLAIVEEALGVIENGTY